MDALCLTDQKDGNAWHVGIDDCALDADLMFSPELQAFDLAHVSNMVLHLGILCSGTWWSDFRMLTTVIAQRAQAANKGNYYFHLTDQRN